MTSDSVVNMTGKPLSEFKDGDSLYVQKMESGYSVDLLCAFRGLVGGAVVADVVSVDPDYRWKWKGMRVRTVARKCFLWGVGEGEVNPRCHWFKSMRGSAE